MDSNQIRNLLNLIEHNIEINNREARKQITRYLGENIDKVAREIQQFGETHLPTSFGLFTLTKADVTQFCK